MTTRIQTENSVYEVDYDQKRIRRTGGVNEPTPNQGPDNVWKDYTALQPMHDRMLVVWPDGMAHLTSSLTSAEEL